MAAKRASATTKKGVSASAQTVACWEDDPGDRNLQPPLTPITVPAPKPATQPLAFKITGSTPAPKVYQPGTANFRYYAAAAALRRTADFWGSIVPGGTKWQVGSVLPVRLDDGVDLNAFYTRGDFQDPPGLHFFHATVEGRTFFSGESPDVCCHEMGHAVLDALRPQLFDAQTIEAAAFHESFGDMSAILSGLQVASLRQAVLQETGGTLNRTSRLSRLAEQLGSAIRAQHPDAVDPDCLRNAVNSFFYRDPQTLPPSAPASALCSEPHSFSRVFTAAFLDSLAGVFKLQSGSGTNDLQKASQDIAKILVGSVLSAPVTPDYYSQVAAHMIAFGEAAPFNGKYRDVLKSAFVRRGILSLQAAVTVTGATAASPRAALIGPPAGVGSSAELPRASIFAVAYGLKRPSLVVHTAVQPKRFAVTSSSLLLGAVEPRSAQNAAESYTEDLFQRGRVDVGQHADERSGLLHPHGFHTHIVVEEKGELVLRRNTFDCGFDR
ncbi:MAG: hypothetical protein C5B51_29555 [Terriglobia bacterium]|nr:MAG: hypothetical protein C5B51_29555 [Terriglobia bacterium]